MLLQTIPKWVWALSLAVMVGFALPCAPHKVVLFNSTVKPLPEVRLYLVGFRERHLVWQGGVSRSSSEAIGFAAPRIGEAHLHVYAVTEDGQTIEKSFGYVDGNILPAFAAVVIGSADIQFIHDLHTANTLLSQGLVVLVEFLDGISMLGRCAVRGEL